MKPDRSSSRVDVLRGASGLLRGVIEGITHILVCLSPWAFGCVEPEFEAILYYGLALLLVLWGLQILLEGRFRWVACPVTVCLACLYLVGVLQLMPLSPTVLATVSPATDRVNRQLLPEQPEVLRLVEPEQPVSPRPGSTLSLYPSGTRRLLMRILAVVLLFAMVRHNLASPGALRRLSIAATVNGVLLAFLGLAQLFSSPPGTVYWVFPSPGAVFGPFINRNHFAFYINLCIGLGGGLLLYTYAKSLAQSSSQLGGAFWHSASRRDERAGHLADTRNSDSGVFNHPALLWIVAAMTLMVASNALTLSRGGFLAMLVAAFGCTSLALWKFPRYFRLEASLLAAIVAVGLVAWVGIDQFQQRFTTILSGQALEDGRKTTWLDSIPLVQQFWPAGTGYGTFQYVDLLHRQSGGEFVNEHAHNEYLEALVEGGAPRLALSLMAVVLILRLGSVALHRHQDSPSCWLVFGALFAVISAAVHSVVEFAVHVPAAAFLLTAIAAMLCGVSEPANGATNLPATEGEREANSALPSAEETDLQPGRGTFSWLGIFVACYCATCAVLLAFVLFSHGWKIASAQRLRKASWRVSAQPETDRQRELAFLEAAVRRAPDHARLQLELADLHLNTYDELNAMLGGSETEKPDVVEARKQFAREHLIPALQGYVKARDLCPLLAQAQYQIGANVELFAAADPRSAYLARVKFLSPADAESWYLCGAQELLDGSNDEAWKSWRRSLELSGQFLNPILEAAGTQVEPTELILKVLPDRPEILLAAAFHDFPKDDAEAQRRPYLEKALAVLESRPSQLSAKDFYTKARICTLLKQTEKALLAFAAALALEPGQLSWRVEFARLLYDHGRTSDARRELAFILGQQPGHAEATKLMAAVAREEAVGRNRKLLP